MKYISLLFVLVFMAWTWSTANSTREYGIRESREMETDIEAAISAFVAKQRPTLKDIRFQQLFTEVIRPNEEIRAHLRYTIVDASADGDTVEQSFQGTLTIKKSKEDQSWRTAAINIQSPLVEFQNGAKISAKDDTLPAAEEPAAQVTPAPAAPAQGSHGGH